MKLPIMAYGEPVLKKRAEEIDKDYPELDAFIDDMFETMDAADGVGLAAPQVGRSVRVIVVDGSPFAQDEELPKEERDFLAGFRREFINPEKLEEWGDKWGFEEGCLSIPGVHEKVFRPQNIRVRYYASGTCTKRPSRDGRPGSSNTNTTIWRAWYLPTVCPPLPNG